MPSANCEQVTALRPPFDVALYEQLLDKGGAVAEWQGLEPWESWQAFRAPGTTTVLRDSLRTEHAPETADLLDQLFAAKHLKGDVRGFAIDIAIGDRGSALLAAIALHEGTPIADRLIDLFAEAYVRSQIAPNHLTADLLRLLPPRVLRDCQAHDSQGVEMPKETVDKHLGNLSALAFGLGYKKPRRQLARDLFEADRTSPAGGSMDALLRDALIRPNYFLTRSLINYLGLDGPISVDKLWQTGYGPDRLPNGEIDRDSKTVDEYVAHNAQQVLDIERLRPGGVRYLARRLQLRNLGRIPEDWLLDLIDNRHKQYAQVILAGIASRCGNGAVEQHTERLNQARVQLSRKDTTIIPVEVSRTVQLERRLVALDRFQRITGAAKIAGAIMLGHGEDAGPNGPEIELCIVYGGRGSHGECLGVTDIEGPIGDLVMRVLDPDAEVLLLSCDMAKGPRSMAQRLHERTGRHVMGMRETGALSHLRVRARHAGGVGFEPQFVHRSRASEEKWQYRRSRVRHFRPAVAVSDQN
ncbi:MAG TPA: hypothetical protein VF466_02095 [Candidatus Saccharimonadales bacterium]